MRILSDFHDYYDRVQSQGQDLDLLYLRKKKKEKLSEWIFPSMSKYRNINSRFWNGFYNRLLSVDIHVVGFCGKIYPVLGISTPSSGDAVLCHKIEAVDRFVEGNCRKKEIKGYYAKVKAHERHRVINIRRISFNTFFETCVEEQSNFADVFTANDCPIWIASVDMHGARIVYNGRLEDLEFYRHIGVYETFQELQMYLGSIARPDKPIPDVSDKDLAAAKGFNKWSFRKPPKS